MEHGPAWQRWIWLGAAAVAGSITSISMMQWKSMDWQEKILAFFVGCGFSVFAARALGTMVFHLDPDDMSLMGLVMYMGATGSNIFIPLLIKTIARRGEKEL